MVCDKCIERFKDGLLVRIELNAQFGLEPIEDVFFVAKII